MNKLICLFLFLFICTCSEFNNPLIPAFEEEYDIYYSDSETNYETVLKPGYNYDTTFQLSLYIRPIPFPDTICDIIFSTIYITPLTDTTSSDIGENMQLSPYKIDLQISIIDTLKYFNVILNNKDSLYSQLLISAMNSLNVSMKINKNKIGDGYFYLWQQKIFLDSSIILIPEEPVFFNLNKKWMEY